MAASKCTVPPHLQAMILVSKLPYQMSALVQSICQTDDIEELKTDDIKRKAILAWEQCSPVQNNNNHPQQPQAARKISAVVPCRFWVRSDQPNLAYNGNPRNWSRPSVRCNIVKIRRNIVEKRRNIVEKHRNVVGTHRNS